MEPLIESTHLFRNSMATTKNQSGINEELQQDYHQKDADDDKPRRPLTAYNLFFQNERKVLVLQALQKEHGSIRHLPPKLIQDYLHTSRKRPHRKLHGVVGFHELTKKVSSKWKMIDPSLKQEYRDLAAKDKFRYNKEIKAWRERQLSARCRQDIRRCSMEHDFKPIFSSSSNKSSNAVSTIPAALNNESNDIMKNNVIACLHQHQKQRRSPSLTSASLTPPSMDHEDYLSPVPPPPPLPDYPVVSDEIIVPDTVTVDSLTSTSTSTNHHNAHDSDNDLNNGIWLPPPPPPLPTKTNNWEDYMMQTQDLSSSSCCTYLPVPSQLLPPPPFANHVCKDVVQIEETANMLPHPFQLPVIDNENETIHTTTHKNDSDHNKYNNHDMEMLASDLDYECLSFLISLKPHHEEEQQFQQQEYYQIINTVPL